MRLGDTDVHPTYVTALLLRFELFRSHPYVGVTSAVFSISTSFVLRLFFDHRPFPPPSTSLTGLLPLWRRDISSGADIVRRIPNHRPLSPPSPSLPVSSLFWRRGSWSSIGAVTRCPAGQGAPIYSLICAAGGGGRSTSLVLALDHLCLRGAVPAHWAGGWVGFTAGWRW